VTSSWLFLSTLNELILSTDGMILGKIKYLGKCLSQSRFVHRKSYMDWRGFKHMMRGRRVTARNTAWLKHVVALKLSFVQ